MAQWNRKLIELVETIGFGMVICMSSIITNLFAYVNRIFIFKQKPKQCHIVEMNISYKL